MEKAKEKAICLILNLIEKGIPDNLNFDNAHSWFENNELEREGYWAASGMTKLCLGHYELDDWVIKIGYCDKEKDFALIEYENYLKALSLNLERFFPKTIYLGEYDNKKFFLQEQAEYDEERVLEELFDELLKENEEDGGDEESNDPEYIWDEVRALDDESRIWLFFSNSDLLDFLNENNINDLHEGNFGYIGDQIVIIDFSGY